MRSTYILGAALAALIAAPAMAQTAGSAPTGTAKTPPVPSTSPATGSAPMTGAMGSQTGVAADTSATAAALAVGLAVKDNTGVSIGTITSLKPEAGGKQTATIKMGADTFAVDSASLAVQGDAAVVNASQAELKAMLAKRGK